MTDPFTPPRLWDTYGTPLLPHVACPICGDADEVYSNFDLAGCYLCQWRGSLTAMHAVAALQAGEFALTFNEEQLRHLAAQEDSSVAQVTHRLPLTFNEEDCRIDTLTPPPPSRLWQVFTNASLIEQLAMVGVAALCILAALAVTASWWLRL